MLALLILTISQLKQKDWDSVFEDWNPTTPERYPFSSSTEGDFYISRCKFEDKSSCAISIDTTSTSRIVLETSYFSNCDVFSGDACALSASNAGCVITKCYTTSCKNTQSTLTATFTSVNDPTDTQPIIYRENSIFDCGRAIIDPNFPELDSYSGVCNSIGIGKVTIETFNITQSSAHRGSAFFFSSKSNNKASITRCEFIDNLCVTTSTIIAQDQCSIFYLGNNREFSFSQCNFLQSDGVNLFYVKATVTADTCSFIKGSKDSFAYLYHDITYTPFFTISNSYIDYPVTSSSDLIIESTQTTKSTNIIIISYI